MHSFLHVVIGVLRSLYRKPGFALTVVLILALGIGANIATLSLLYRYFYAPLPYPKAQQLIAVRFNSAQSGLIPAVSIPAYHAIRAQAPVLQDAAVFNWAGFNLTHGRRSVRIDGIVSTASLFSTLAVKPLLGNVFSRASEQPGAEPVIVLSYKMWKELLQGDEHVIGKTLTLNNRAYTVIAVMPENFWFPNHKALFWAPLTLTTRDDSLDSLGSFDYAMIARIKPRATLTEFAVQASAIFNQAVLEMPASVGRAMMQRIRWQARPEYWRQQLVGGLRQPLNLMLLATGLLILLAWFNLTNLFVVRALARRTELVLRRVLGAGIGRLFALQLSESLALCVVGAGLGLLLGHLLLVQLLAYIGPTAGNTGAPVVGWLPSVGFALVLGLLSSLVFSVIGFYFVHRQDLASVLRAGGTHASHDRGARRARATLVVAQIALACSLCGMCLLLARSLLNLSNVNLGFRSQNTVTFKISLPVNQYSPQQTAAALTALHAKLLTEPEITSASIATHVPFAVGQDSFAAFPYPWDHHTTATLFTTLTDADYFRTLGIPLLAGRTFISTDRAQGTGVAVIDERAARKLFGTTQALGRQFTFGNHAVRGSLFTVIGVVRAVHSDHVGQASEFGSVYLDRDQTLKSDNSIWNGESQWIVVLRTPLAPARVLPLVRAAMSDLLSGIPIFDMQTMGQRVGNQLAGRRGLVLLVAIFSLSALLLAGVGLYAVQNYAVHQRTREFGIRIALGANRLQLLQLMLSEAGRLLISGVILGLAGMVTLAEAFSSALYGVYPVDPTSMLIVLGVLTLALLLAAWLPAWRASCVVPAVTLRE